jgi:hypothetical protein
MSRSVHEFREILPTNPDVEPPNDDFLSLDEDTEAPLSAAALSQETSKLSRWIEQAADSSCNECRSARACLIKYTDKYPSRRSIVFNLLLSKGLDVFKRTGGKYFTKNAAYVDAFNLLKTNCKWEQDVFDELVTDAGLRLVDRWDAFLRQSLIEFSSYVVPSATILVATKYIRHLADKKVIPASIFIIFWKKMIILFRQSWDHDESECPLMIHSVLENTNAYVFTNAACLEIDAFYRAVEEARKIAEANRLEFTAEVYNVRRIKTSVSNCN